jgi:tRNA (adenine22-N1)-methyltransferase
MNLNHRLAMIAEKIPRCSILADIGTDHAFIPIFAVENGLCERALAADLREGPLKMASANIMRRGLENRIETRLGNGLEPISLEESDVFVIAGMGGVLICDILAASKDKARKAGLLLLQANNAVDVLRRWLYENEFEISEEKLTLDMGKLYCLILARWTGMREKKDFFECYVGEKLLEGKDPLLGYLIDKKLRELDVIIEGRERADADKLHKKAERSDLSEITKMEPDALKEIRKKLENLKESIQEQAAD